MKLFISNIYIYIYIYFLSIYLFDTSLVSSFEHVIQSALRSRAVRQNYKTTEYLRMKGVFDSIELQMLRRAYYLPTHFPTQYEILTAFCSCERVTLQGYYALSYSLLFLAFATRWNPKQFSYVSTRLFCNFYVACYLYVTKSF